MKIAVIGLGYVGLPLSVQFASNGVDVLGLDVDLSKVAALQQGESYIRRVSSESIAKLTKDGFFEASSEFERIAEVSAVLICVPTPLGKYREPDLSFVHGTATTVAQNMAKGTLVILESTTYPGTTEGELRQILEDESGMRAGIDFHIAFSPEREDPGNPESEVGKIPKIVGGLTPACLERAKELYSVAIQNLVPVSSCRAAEASKLLENIFRAVNIALVNELKMIYQEMDIDIWEVIEAAKTKPYGFMPFYPGPGLGGHCIPVDPFYLTWKAREFGQHTRFIELAGEINSSIPKYVVNRVREVLNESNKPLKASKVLLIGLAYKPNVNDMRESPAFELMNLMQASGALIDYFDPHILEIPPSRDNPSWKGKKSIDWDESNIRSYDVVLISTAHDCIDYAQLGAWATVIVDTRNIMSTVSSPKADIYKA